MRGRSVDLSKAVIVVAHPDDELLWFAGALPHVRRTVMCYGDNPLVPNRGENRRWLVNSYPSIDIEFLDIQEPRTRPMRAGPGIPVADAIFAAPSEDECRLILSRKLKGVLEGGADTILTHNPWGESGHKDHTRVNFVVNSLAQEMDIPVYVSSYAGLRTFPRCEGFLKQGVLDFFESPIRMDFVREIHAHYLEHACWTWNKNWNWPERDIYLRLGAGGPANASVALRVFDWPVRPMQKTAANLH
jgi:LmbE family N-acetylglucosaminyl deacetylase